VLLEPCAVFQILRGSEMLFAALFAVLFLRRHLNRWHFLGVALCMVRLRGLLQQTACRIKHVGCGVKPSFMIGLDFNTCRHTDASDIIAVMTLPGDGTVHGEA
jgi:hypothetical protein